MSNRLNNKRLFIILAVLLILLALTVMVRIPKGNATLKTSLINVDTSQVCKIVIYQGPELDQAVEFNREGDNWTVQQGSITASPAKGVIQEIFGQVLSIKPQSLAAKSKATWQEFQVTDSLGTRVKFFDKKGKTLSDMVVGKTTYKQTGNPYAGNGGGGVTGTTYLRLYDEKEVYAAEGFLSFFFKRRFSDWRDKTFIHAGKNDILSLEFSYPADSSFTLTKKDQVWFAGNQLADSLQVDRYLNALANMNGQTIRDTFEPISNPDYQIIAEGNNLLSFTVKCYMDPSSGEYILNSSMNPDVYFSSRKDGIFSRLFVPKSHFLGKEKK